MADKFEYSHFKDINLDDPFFDSLKAQYEEFADWFLRKAEEKAYVLRDDDDQITGFIYLKIENEIIDDVTPQLPAAHRLKVGTFKIDAHGTRLGERVIKKIFDHALQENAEEVYVTVFDTHEALISLFEKYGFIKIGTKTTPNGSENVYLRSLRYSNNDIIKDYPLFRTSHRRKFLLAVHPEYHTELFPDSILNNEDSSIVEDVSHTNTIHKVYVAKLSLTRMERGDLIVIYRTTDNVGPAFYRSVATSICVVEETKKRRNFSNVEEFVRYAEASSVFDREALIAKYNAESRLFCVKMTYNAALTRRIIRGVLLDQVGISEQPRWDLRELTDDQFNQIIELGQVNESLIIN
ncbi:GNAT family N-acetyltransferase [Pseudovibrio sp. JE062]|uniref:GNAT family N-acetyltransferase n=1 Tax=Pseudovibrio sp. JE062 TaxID=439495 RepID=UPI00055AE0DC|nr:GNAT family N-acetyltransferase [Pseudovibrio sp. JE062]